MLLFIIRHKIGTKGSAWCDAIALYVCNVVYLSPMCTYSQDPTFEKALQGMELLQQQLQSGGGGGGGGGGDHENSEDRGQLLAVRPLDLENPLEVHTATHTIHTWNSVSESGVFCFPSCYNIFSVENTNCLSLLVVLEWLAKFSRQFMKNEICDVITLVCVCVCMHNSNRWTVMKMC